LFFSSSSVTLIAISSVVVGRFYGTPFGFCSFSLGAVPSLRLIREGFPDDPVLDTAVSRAVLERVAAGELPETLRIARPAAVVAFGKQDAISPGYGAAANAARAVGFEAVLRLAGGRAAVFHERTIAFAHALPAERARAGVFPRFEATAERMARAFRRLGVDARVGEVPGEYCPGRYSVNARGRAKLMGVGQRVIAGGAHLGGVVVVDQGERVRDVLVPVYAALGLDWDPATAGSMAAEAPGLSWEDVANAILGVYAEERELVDAELDGRTLALARRLAPQHRSPR
jgi:octanoyl-[GcvH]:protein N-octanoyltransferase